MDALIQTDDNPPEFIRVQATGVEIGTPDVFALISGSRDVEPLKWGDFQSISSFSFSTGGSKYGDLQDAVFVGSTSLRVGPKNGTFVVGFKIEKVLSAETGLSV